METESNTKEYEVSFLAKDEKGSQEVLAVLKKMKAEIVSEGSTNRINLAYPIARQSQADFGCVQFILDPIHIHELDSTFKGLSSLIRFLIVTPPFGKRSPRPQAGFASRGTRYAEKAPEQQRVVTEPLTNEALEKKIEEILK